MPCGRNAHTLEFAPLSAYGLTQITQFLTSAYWMHPLRGPLDTHYLPRNISLKVR